MKVCVAIISIGKLYIEEFEKNFKPSIVSNCTKYGYDLKIFNDFLDTSKKHPSLISFQKALIPSQDCMKEYDLIVVMDADIYIIPIAPPIHTLDLNGKIGMVSEFNQLLNKEEFEIIKTASGIDSNYYNTFGFEDELKTELYLNSGLMICNPVLHGDFLKNIYEKYSEKALNHPRGFHYEQGSIGYEIIRNNMVTVIPNDWNHIYFFDYVLKKSHKPFFIHFAGIRKSDRETALNTFLIAHSLKGRLTWRKH